MKSLLTAALLFLAGGAHAAGAGCQDTTGTNFPLEKVRAGAVGSQPFGCINRSFEALASSVPINSTSAVTMANMLKIYRISGHETGQVGIEISSYTWFSGSSVTIAGGGGLVVRYALSAGSAAIGGSTIDASGNIVLASNGDLTLTGPTAYAVFPASVTGSQFYGPLIGNVVGNLTGNVAGSASGNVLKVGDTMTGELQFVPSSGGGEVLSIFMAGSGGGAKGIYIDPGLAADTPLDIRGYGLGRVFAILPTTFHAEVRSGLDLVGAATYLTAQSSVNASAFFGNGAGLTGITDSSKVAKAGDTMTGDLNGKSIILTGGFAVTTGTVGGTPSAGGIFAVKSTSTYDLTRFFKLEAQSGENLMAAQEGGNIYFGDVGNNMGGFVFHRGGNLNMAIDHDGSGGMLLRALNDSNARIPLVLTGSIIKLGYAGLSEYPALDVSGSSVTASGIFGKSLAVETGSFLAGAFPQLTVGNAAGPYYYELGRDSDGSFYQKGNQNGYGFYRWGNVDYPTTMHLTAAGALSTLQGITMASGTVVGNLSVSAPSAFALTVSEMALGGSFNADGAIRAVDSASGKVMQMYHDGTDGYIGSSYLGGTYPSGIKIPYTTAGGVNVNGIIMSNTGTVSIPGAEVFSSSGTTTPTHSCAGGSLTSASVSVGAVRLGKTATFSVDVAITTAGSCTGNVNFTMPYTASDGCVLMGRENNATGNPLIGNMSGGSTLYVTAISGNIAGDGYLLQLSGSCLVD